MEPVEHPGKLIAEAPAVKPRWTTRALWWIVNVILIVVILGLLTAILLPIFVGAEEDRPDFPSQRDRRR
jgi:hypothetical protein